MCVCVCVCVCVYVFRCVYMIIFRSNVAAQVRPHLSSLVLEAVRSDLHGDHWVHSTPASRTKSKTRICMY